eukprot:TRINITY_DN29417_c0_g1_i2.p1 TRINITY_DN29417_c0_g1~~TRINITY_DN29417_c0_g1_i2.p1  ORF type:complete len:476 (-),score=107.56 TRINITY_DN29417_c0_g1_i2:38-1465(-)
MASRSGLESTGWVEGLGLLKDFEVRRRAAFADWAEAVSARVAAERRRQTSAQLLLAAVRTQIRDRAEADEELAKRLAKMANRDLAKSQNWLGQDLVDASYLPALQRYCAQNISDASKAFRAVLEGSDAFKQWEALAKEPTKSILEMEQALRATKARSDACVNAWAKHEAQCRQQLTQESGGDLWSSEAVYRRAASQFASAIVDCQQTLVKVCNTLEGGAAKHRSLTLTVLKDVAACIATCYNSLARAVTPLPGGALPQVPGFEQHAHQQSPVQVPLPSWQADDIPESVLKLHEGLVERPAGLLRQWQPCRLLLTVQGSVHCFDGKIEDKVKAPYWSGQPSAGSALAAVPNARTLAFHPAKEWLKRRRPLTVRATSMEDFVMWQQALGSWWQDASQAQACSMAAADGGGGVDAGDEDSQETVDSFLDPSASADCCLDSAGETAPDAVDVPGNSDASHVDAEEATHVTGSSHIDTFS